MESKVSKMKSCFDASLLHNGEPPLVWVARINHSFDGGLHIFTSEDVSGLCVASRQLDVCIRQLPVVIADLVRMNDHMDVEVVLGSQSPLDRKPQQPDRAVISKRVAVA